MLSNINLTRKYIVNGSTCVAFLAIQNQNQKGEIIAKPLGLAIVQLIGNYYQNIEVVRLEALELDRVKMINIIFDSLSVIHFDSVYIDKDNYLKFNNDKIWSEQSKIFTFKSQVKAPSLRPTLRSDNLIYRQKEILDTCLLEGKSDNQMFFASNIPKEYRALINRLGENPVVDALAGASEQILKIQKQIYYSLAKQQNGRVVNYTIN